MGPAPSCILGSRAPRHLQPEPVVTKRIPQPRSELSPDVRAHEAKLLAMMLRTSRLTLVFAEPGTDKGALLKSGVMPLLQRRRSDRGTAPSAAANAAVSAPDRRRRPARPRAEAAIHFEDWGPAPLSALKRRIMDIVPAGAAEADDATLADMLQRLHQRLGLQFVFLLDRFEEYLALAPDDSEVGQFADELVAVVVQRDLPASFLIAMDEDARTRLERFRAGIPGFDHDVLRLSPVSAERDQAPAAPPAALTENTARAPHPRRPPPRVPVKVEDVYAFIESTLARTSRQWKPADGLSEDPKPASNPRRPSAR